ncbi:MAG: winged helix-turn-helix domain-containing protein [Nitrososphaerota archaeon]|nr:winged helix-turn-helix domain-containing protein [Nitrososphaerota archaeon]
MGIPYQTIRFRMGRLGEQGISVLPIVDAQKIGLDRVRVTFELPSDIANLRPIFAGLHVGAGLRFYARTLVSHEFDSEFLIPRGKLDEFGRLLRALEEMRLIENVQFNRLRWKDFIMMRTKYFDYESGEWDVDFSKLAANPSEEIPQESEPTKVDSTDLQIIKSLEVDPWIRVVELAEKVGMSVGDASYHLNRHVFGKKLISSFRLKWIGTKEAWSKHTMVGQTFVFKQLSDEMARHAIAIMTATPFTWNHMRAEDGTYISELLIPVSLVPETMGFVSERLRQLRLKPEMRYQDWSCTSNFTIPYMMFEPRTGWNLEAESALGHILQTIQQYEHS